MTFINVAILTALCLPLPVTRIYGVIGLGILLYFRHLLSFIVLILALIAYYLYRRTTFMMHLKSSRPGTFRTKNRMGRE